MLGSYQVVGVGILSNRFMFAFCATENVVIELNCNSVEFELFLWIPILQNSC